MEHKDTDVSLDERPYGGKTVQKENSEEMLFYLFF